MVRAWLGHTLLPIIPNKVKGYGSLCHMHNLYSVGSTYDSNLVRIKLKL